MFGAVRNGCKVLYLRDLGKLSGSSAELRGQIFCLNGHLKTEN